MRKGGGGEGKDVKSRTGSRRFVFRFLSRGRCGQTTSWTAELHLCCFLLLPLLLLRICCSHR